MNELTLPVSGELQNPTVEQWLRNYHQLKESLERICEINLELLQAEKLK